MLEIKTIINTLRGDFAARMDGGLKAIADAYRVQLAANLSDEERFDLSKERIEKEREFINGILAEALKAGVYIDIGVGGAPHTACLISADLIVRLSNGALAIPPQAAQTLALDAPYFGRRPYGRPLGRVVYSLPSAGVFPKVRYDMYYVRGNSGSAPYGEILLAWNQDHTTDIRFAVGSWLSATSTLRPALEAAHSALRALGYDFHLNDVERNRAQSAKCRAAYQNSDVAELGKVLDEFIAEYLYVPVNEVPDDLQERLGRKIDEYRKSFVACTDPFILFDGLSLLPFDEKDGSSVVCNTDGSVSIRLAFGFSLRPLWPESAKHLRAVPGYQPLGNLYDSGNFDGRNYDLHAITNMHGTEYYAVYGVGINDYERVGYTDEDEDQKSSRALDEARLRHGELIKLSAYMTLPNRTRGK